MVLLNFSCTCWFVSLVYNSVNFMKPSCLPFYFKKYGKENWDWTKKLWLCLEGFKLSLIWGVLLPSQFADTLVLQNFCLSAPGALSQKGGVSHLFSVCHQIQSRRYWDFLIQNHSEWDGEIFEVCLVQPYIEEEILVHFHIFRN